MAVADDLDHATDSRSDWVAEQTRTYLASGGTEGHESNGSPHHLRGDIVWGVGGASPPAARANGDSARPPHAR
ncbi:hypothetical protein SAMN04490356_0020 [Streptomyces melanosporofaciens]|uniref:Uncharacterized protein n=1 Tax=Streptomyces melanosporofaciens TaxID=67327 RepID=A0A1H4I6G8_STRMJ|nr:hypothetical protein SAMN04490356_0020 [Streptomyces melanosporofaciens]